MSAVGNILHRMHLTPGPDEDETPMTAEQREALESSDRGRRARETEKKPREIDLLGLVEAAKLGREYAGATLELHPKTLKDDPILRTSDDTSIPPSQDARFMKFVALNKARRPQPLRRQSLRGPRRQGQQQQQQQGSWRRHFTWEALLRSKRR